MASRALLLTLANALIPAAILVFATGFFPYKPFMSGLATYEELGFEEYGMGTNGAWDRVPEAKFDRLVFMVVDALRSDFVFGEGSGMGFVQSLIRNGEALPFTAHATSPTITMPRVKAITTGSIPSFLDVILNFAESDTTSTLATQDTWLAQLKAKGKGAEDSEGKLVMYGDDTWLKLFPNFFTRSDGTSSFFVSDFTEVDNNVTRHIHSELLNSDWNAMIMHYLGLDHIGHKAGPTSPNMIPKQKEMDGIVQQIYEAIENEDHLANTLLVLCGDHGMNDGGNHGGSAPGETSPALVFMSPKLKDVTEGKARECPTTPRQDFDFYNKIEQSDIAPTLAGLMGFPVPKNNLGVFIPEFLYLWKEGTDRIQLLLRNARQMKKIVEATFPGNSFGDEIQDAGFEGGDSGAKLATKWQNVVRALDPASTTESQLKLDAIYEFCRTAQDIMSSTASNYDVSRLVLGSALAFVSVALTFVTLVPKMKSISSTGVFYTLTLVLYGVLMFASSYVEEEHHFWYWTTSAWFAYLFVFASRKEWFSKFAFHPAIMLLLLHRIIRRWNQTGQKYAGAPDIAHSAVLTGSNSLVLWSLIGAVYMDITLRLSRHVARSISHPPEKRGRGGAEEADEPDDGAKAIGTLGVLPLGATAFVFKLSFTARDAPELVQGVTEGLLSFVTELSLVPLARMVFSGILLSASWLVFSEWRKSTTRRQKGQSGRGDLALALFDLLTLFLVTQTRAQNIPLYLLFRAQLFFLSLLSLPPTEATVTSLLLTHASFFALGNTNAISSIDLSNSYNGVSGYNVGAVGVLVFLSNWAGPVWWTCAGVLLLLGVGRGDGGVWSSPSDRYFDDKEVEAETRDWVAKEREHLTTLLASNSSKDKEKRGSEVDGKVWGAHIALLTLFTSASLLAVMVACTVLRQHLFIWTVFSPKYLYAMAWGIAWQLGVGAGFGGVLWWVGRW